MSLVEYRGSGTLHQSVSGNEWIELVAPAASLANQIATTEFVPKEFRNKPDAITACILYGAELGLGPMVSLSKIAVIQGKPAPYAELGRALALAAGHEIWVEESTNTRVTVSGKRKGSTHVQTVTWTSDDVKKAGISNHNYTKYPRQMLLARASAELVRAMCPDALGGIAVFAEEAEGMADDGPVAASEPAKPANKRRRLQPVEEQPDAPPVEDAGEITQTEDGPTKAQTGKAMALFTEISVTDRDERLSLTSSYIGREIESWKDVTKAEAATVIDRLENAAASLRPVGNRDLPPLPGDDA
jgi:hypothetical protein